MVLPKLVFAGASVGCGLGSLIWKKNTVVSALFRLTTNHSFSSQLFGITTGTSGCSKHNIVLKTKEPLYYVEVNKEELLLDMAKGEGEILTGMSNALGCSNKKSIHKSIKENFNTIRYQNSTQFLGDIVHIIKKNNLHSKCSNIII